jgi:hypothetical membrane protein
MTVVSQRVGTNLGGLGMISVTATTGLVEHLKVDRHAAAQVAGLLLLIAGVIILMGIITAEALYPAVYTTHENEISDLGATRPPNSIILQPSATIFNTVMMITGLMILSSTYFLHQSFSTLRVTVSVVLLGLGVLGVGIFPGNREAIHPLLALTAFISGGFAAVLSFKVQGSPFRYVSIFLGSATLLSLVVGLLGDITPIFSAMGDGGVERWIAYPTVLWMVGFGGYLMSRGSTRNSSPC